MTSIPDALPQDILDMIDSGATEVAAKEVAKRYNVSSIEGLRVVNNVRAGAAANADFRHRPPDEVYVARRPRPDLPAETFRMEVRYAPPGTKFRDEYKTIRTHRQTGEERNSVQFTWDEAVAQAERRVGIAPNQWERGVTSD